MHPLVWGAAAAAGIHAVSLFAEVRGVHDWLEPGAVWRTAAAHAVLTFDDGPDPHKTPRLLDVLADAGATAVFFVIGERAARHPELVRRAHLEGHVIGNHSWSHPWMPRLSSRRIAEEIDHCQAVVRDITGVAPALARPPYGQKDYRYYRVLAERGLTPVLWSRNLRDYHRSGPDALLRRLSRVGAGDIVLAHDGDPLAPHTVAAVEAWLPSAPPLGTP